jgi:hypothetical protein
VLKEAFPDAKLVALPETVKEIEKRLKAQYPNLGSDFSLKLGLQSAYKR